MELCVGKGAREGGCWCVGKKGVEGGDASGGKGSGGGNGGGNGWKVFKENKGVSVVVVGVDEWGNILQ